ncbi:hypothetical protein CF319_g6032 [Tilletia indica]|nr:hypothetical protein CF319_g6032 [Tilletia indica]
MTATELDVPAPRMELTSNGIFDFGDEEEDELVDELQSDDERAPEAEQPDQTNGLAAASKAASQSADPDFDDDELDALAEAHVLRPIDNTASSNATQSNAHSPAKAALNAFGSARGKSPVVDPDEEEIDLDAEIAAYEAERAQQQAEREAVPRSASNGTEKAATAPQRRSAPAAASVSRPKAALPVLKSRPPPVSHSESSISALTVMASSIRMKLKAKQNRPEQAATVVRPFNNQSAGSELWVDKHRPQHFTELLGDDRLHREAMSWLKQWDQCVFKRKPKKRVRTDPQAGGLSGGIGAADGGKAPWEDPWGRPQERVLLISGPPGLGKTTLANIIATQAGYGVFELNASDARNAGAVENIVKMALQSASLKNPKRPTLVLVDEIDGATGGAMASGSGAGAGGGGEGGGEGGFVRALIKLIEGGRGSKGKGKDKIVSKPLLRPIICVCNDAFAPALRGLRPMAKLLRYNRPPTQTLVKRLKEVCELEDMRADTRCLSTLVDMAQGDVRACINALQFLKTRSSKITEADINGAASALGLKDGGASMHRVWNLLFHAPSSRERARSLEPRDARRTSDKIVREATLCGDFDKVALGCFEHYPKLALVDDGWARFKEAHEWLYFAGCIQDSVWKTGTGTFDLLGFLPWTFVPWHNLFANTKNTMPEYPRVDYEHFVKRTAFSEITTALHTSLPPSLRTLFHVPGVVTELGPSLMRMLNPDLRPVNNQLVRTEERRTLTSLVNIMLHLNLRFVHDRMEDGSLSMRLEPPLDAFVQYDGRRSKDVAASRFAVRQIVVREMEAEVKRRRAGLMSEGGPRDGRSAGAQKVLAQYLPADQVGSASGSRQGGGVSLKSKVAADKAAVDFFGRAIAHTTAKESKGKGTGKGKELIMPASTTSLARTSMLPFDDSDLGDSATASAKRARDDSSEEPPAKKLKVFFRFHEGFSNAVRKKITLSQLM